MIYMCRRRGALGVATEALHADDVDMLRLYHPDMEPLAGFVEVADAQKYLLGLRLDVIARREFERSILSRTHS